MKTKLLSALMWAMFIFWTINSNAQTGVTKLGTNALAHNATDGIYNTALGYYSLYSNTHGNKNTASGANTLRANTIGNGNTANGYASLYENNTGGNNTGVGAYTLFYNTSGSYNIALGGYSLHENKTGSYNTCSGYQSLYNNTANYNTASGYKSLYSNIGGDRNTATGYNSLYTNISGYFNTAIGYAAMYYNTTGFYNTATGYAALYNNTSGTSNTALGYFADVSTGNLTNATVIGYRAKVDASNKVRIGNTSVTSIGGQVGWTTFSDGRYKKDIKENVQGLAFINSLRPVTYTVNIKGLNEYYNKGKKQVSDNEALDNKDEVVNAEVEKAEDAAGKMVHNGFIAQEVEEAAKKLNYEFSGVDKPQSKDGLYGLRYDNFIVPLVKAVQELSKMNDEKDAKIDGLQKQIDELKIMISSSNSNLKTGATLSNISIEQNVPNPFSKTTTIGYSLPEKFTRAQIIVADKNGKIVKQVNISGNGKGSVNIDVASLSSGIYNYSLLVDGKIAGSKQMVLVK